MRYFLILAFLPILAGCFEDLKRPTSEAGPIVRALDNAAGVKVASDGTTTQGPTGTEVGGILGTVLTLASLGWFVVRKLAASVPQEVHSEAVKGLANSTPVPERHA